MLEVAKHCDYLGVVRYASKATGVTIYVTENGIATNDDEWRVEYYRRALAGLKRAIDDGVDVRGYITWSLLDNFECTSGFEPKFGVVAVDRAMQKRTIKPSGDVLGNIATQFFVSGETHRLQKNFRFCGEISFRRDISSSANRL